MGKHTLSKFVCTVFVFCAAAVSSRAQTFTTLLNFDGANGAYPEFGPLIQGTDGNFYGTTFEGGANNVSLCTNLGAAGCGTVFKITPGGTLTTLYNFCPKPNCTDGAAPSAGLVLGTDGNFYGTTVGGGSLAGFCVNGCGTVFKITPGGTLTTLHAFVDFDGAGPNGLVQGTDGNFYGTTEGGGGGSAGAVFKITSGGTFTTLHSFGGTDGAIPQAALIQGTDGNFYGTTTSGGVSTCAPNGCGTIFKINAGGTLTTLYKFCSQPACTDGFAPDAPLMQATDGNFYGTASGGGAHSNGTVFKITPGGTLTTVHSFSGADGANPLAGLVQATDGNVYGTTWAGGASNACSSAPCGTVFKMTPAGTLTTVHSFVSTDGDNPFAGLLQATDGNFYGTALRGGTSKNCNVPAGVGCGTIFSLGVGLGPFVETRPTVGLEGTTVIILGNNLTGATGVRFNGTAATFSVVSSSAIQTTVPVGATTGIVQVTTPGGTLNSNVPFQVTKTRKRLVQVTSE